MRQKHDEKTASCVPPLTAADERRLAKALHRALDVMEETGVDVHAAMAKAAAELNVPRGHLPLMTRCYNISCFEQLRKTGADVFSRAQDHDVADAEKVTALLYDVDEPTSAKSAWEVSSEYAVPPDVEQLRRLCDAEPLEVKLARLAVEEPDDVDTVGALARRQRSAARLEGQAVAERDRCIGAMRCMERSLRKAADWFRRHRDASVAGVRETCETALGAVAGRIFDALSDNYQDLAKRAGERIALTPERYAPMVEPYASVRECLAHAARAVDHQQRHSELEKEAAELRDKLRCHVVPPYNNLGLGPAPRELSPPAAEKEVATDKSAGIFLGALGAATGTQLGRNLAMQSPVQDRALLEEKAYKKLRDPEHENALRAIQSEATLNDLLANDEVIRGYDPQEVADNFNELAQMAPRIVNQTGVMRAYLRRKLTQGALDPFELDTLLKMEQLLKKRDTPAPVWSAMAGEQA